MCNKILEVLSTCVLLSKECQIFFFRSNSPIGWTIWFCLFFKTFTSNIHFYSIIVGEQNSVDIFIWETGHSAFRYFQSLDFGFVNKMHSFTPASGIGKDLSLLISPKVNMERQWFWSCWIGGALMMPDAGEFEIRILIMCIMLLFTVVTRLYRSSP